MSDMRQQAINVMLGVHLGDALGVPYEMMTRQEILDATKGRGVTGPGCDLDPSARKLADTRGLPPGSTSDDSQLADATADGLIMAGRYDHELQVLLHLQALWHDVAGWGGTTKRSLYEIDKWYRSQVKGFGSAPPPSFKKRKDEKLWDEAVPRKPSEPARWYDRARGNGPSMQIAPFGIRYAMLGGGDFESGEALEEIMTFSRITHADPICGIAAYAVAGIICDSITDDPDVAADRLMPRVLAAEATYGLLHRGPDRFSRALKYVLSLPSDVPESLWTFGSAGTSDSLTSVPMAIAIWMRHVADFGPQPAVLEAINAGGDTDTVAAMVGAMMGAADDRPDWWPGAWIDALHDRAAPLRLGHGLWEVGSLKRPPDGYDLAALKRKLGY